MFLTIISLELLSFKAICAILIFDATDYIPWSPQHANRPNHMLCPNNACTPNEIKNAWTREDCCVCYARPEWEVPTNKMLEVKLEYIRRGGKAVILNKQYEQNVFLHLQHDSGYLSEIPANICDFQRLVKIELRYNYITEISNISCLSMLDTLDLSRNKIKAIENDTFVSLSNLRVLNVAYNGLQYLAPSTISGPSLQLFNVDFSHNAMTQMEFSNMISETDFCKIDFSSNTVKELVNTNGYKINETTNYFGGMVDLGGNNFTSFIDFEKLGITDIAILGKVISYGFKMTDMKWTCDCHMEPYLELAEDVIQRIWRDYFNITCYNPEEHRGKTIPELVKSGHLDLFICNLTTQEKCPPKCKCFYQPKERRTVVNCTNVGLKELPNFVPDKNNLTLLFAGNNITSFEHRDYFNRTSNLNLSNNKINNITKEALSSLKTEIHLSLANNTIEHVPQEVQNFDPCKVDFGDVTKECKCGDTWLKNWVKNRQADQCNKSSTIICRTDGRLIPAAEITKDILCKEEHFNVAPIILSVLCVLALSVSSLIYYFRYEIYILKRNHISRQLPNKIAPRPKYDAFFSFNDDNETLRMWAMEVLARELEASGYKVFVPCRDLSIGVVREEELLEKIVCSKHYIVLLCDSYIEDDTPWTGIEWKYIWHKFTDILERNIIIVNFDQLDRGDLTDLKLKAFLRLGYDLDFSNRKHELIKKIKEQLGIPLMSTHFNQNRKPKFFSQNLVRNKYVFDNDKTDLFGYQFSLPGSVSGSEVSFSSDQMTQKENLENDKLKKDMQMNDQKVIEDLNMCITNAGNVEATHKENANAKNYIERDSSDSLNGDDRIIDDMHSENMFVNRIESKFMTNAKPRFIKQTKSEATLSDIDLI